jgi:Lrp/AsnC family transcriptional regulator, leucine-responsive regulatory protein
MRAEAYQNIPRFFLRMFRGFSIYLQEIRKKGVFVQNSVAVELDKIDRSILAELQKDGRLPNVQLAELVGLSESACLRRVRMLEQSGIIARYVMLVDQGALGKPGNVFVRVTLDGQQREKLAGFEEAIRTVPEAMECYLMSGDVDYLVRVIVKDTDDYVRLHNRLTGLPGVLRVQSSFALRTVLSKTELPLEALP